MSAHPSGDTYIEVKIYLIYNRMYSSYSQPAYIYIYILRTSTHMDGQLLCVWLRSRAGFSPSRAADGGADQMRQSCQRGAQQRIPHSDWNTRIHVHIHIQPTEKSRENQKIILLNKKNKKCTLFPPSCGYRRSLAIRPIAIPN